MLKTTLLIIFIGLHSMFFGQNKTLLFTQNSYELSAKSCKELDELAEKIKRDEIHSELTVVGHTDRDASDRYNEELALNRARKVMEYLQQKGITNSFALLSRGKKEPLNSNKTEVEKSLNRRVEIHLKYKGDIDTPNYFSQTFDQAPQIFTIDPRQGGEITTAQGIIITIKPRSFQTKAFSTPIDIHVKEYTGKNHFIGGQLTTLTTDNQLLESRGMVQIDALQKGDTLDLERGTAIDIFFPDREVNDRTELFRGVRQSQESISWIQTTKTTAANNRQAGGETNWYEEGAYVKRTRWNYEKKGDETVKITRIEIKQNITIDTVVASPTEIQKILTQQSYTLGWINCDRFYNNTNPRVDMIVEIEGEIEPSIYLVFDDINAIIPYSHRENNRYFYKFLPAESKVSVIALLKTDTKEEVYFSKQKTTIQQDLTIKLQLQKISDAEMKNEMQSLCEN